MADFERGLLISQLPPSGSLTPETMIEIELEGRSHRATVAQVLTLLGDDLVTSEHLETRLRWATEEW